MTAVAVMKNGICWVAYKVKPVFLRIKTKYKFCIICFKFLNTEEIPYLQLYIQFRPKLEETNALMNDRVVIMCVVFLNETRKST